ncbi:helix-turn-helix transcriptional regulator [Cyanobium sp. Morenito 9A2]|nr:helix-turn-helix transcriptional regulator [Cyanobium sp. Morenito 9A2]
MQIHTAIKKAREDAHLSQEHLADLAGIHRTYVSQLERGIKVPTLTILERICSALSIRVSELVAMAEAMDDVHCQ